MHLSFPNNLMEQLNSPPASHFISLANNSLVVYAIVNSPQISVVTVYFDINTSC